jgi:hypothetical protein
MNRLVLWLANALLAVAACATTAWVLGQAPATAADARGDESKAGRGERKADRKGAPRDVAEADGLAAGNPAADADVLWQQSLFRPERTEDLTQPTAEDPAVAAAALNLELVGLARIGERAVAVIVSHRGAAPRRAGAPAGPGRNPRPGVLRPPAAPEPGPGGPAEAGAPEPEGPPDRHVYKVGDTVGDSGYTLKEIRLKEKEVVLVRGSEERVLKLETADDQSASRRETAATQAAAQAAAAAAAQAAAAKAAEVAQAPAAKPPAEGAAVAVAAAGAPPPPPPMPGAVGVPGAPGAPPAGAAPATPAEAVAGKEGTPAVPMTREERLERARLLRERILQGRNPASPQ